MKNMNRLKILTSVAYWVEALESSIYNNESIESIAKDIVDKIDEVILSSETKNLKIVDMNIDENVVNVNPRYEHDCDQCVYLGEHREFDLYYCPTDYTVISRYGSNGADYSSGLVFARPDGIEPLYEAKRRAIKKGYSVIN